MTCSEKSCRCAKFTLKAICSSVGLCTVVVGYVLIGGYLFKFIEGKREWEELQAAQVKKSGAREDLFKHLQTALTENVDRPCFQHQAAPSASPNEKAEPSGHSEEKTRLCIQNIFQDENFLYDFNMKLNSYEQTVFGVDAPDLNGTDKVTTQWTLANSVLFATTVITTIGYGNLVPKTSLGQFVCMVYAMIGVPLMLITLASMGNFMATCFRFTYQRCCYPFCSFVMRPCKPYQASQHNRNNRRARNGNNEATSQTATTEEDEESYTGSLQASQKKKHRPKEIPIYLSLLVIVIYLIVISAMFKFWEDWGWLKAIYFCFITFSTIGFGDVVPGATIEKQDEQSYKSALCAVSVLFGLAIMSMCFNLMQNTIFSYFQDCTRKVRRLGDKDETSRFGSPTRTETCGNESMFEHDAEPYGGQDQATEQYQQQFQALPITLQQQQLMAQMAQMQQGMMMPAQPITPV